MKRIPLLINATIESNVKDFGRMFRLSFRRADGHTRYAAFGFDPDCNLDDFCNMLREAADKIEKDSKI